MEERQPQPVEDRRDVAPRRSQAAGHIRVDEGGASALELALSDLVGCSSRHRRHLRQGVPLQRHVARLCSEPLTRLDKPRVAGGAEDPSGTAEPQIHTSEHLCRDAELTRHHKPRGKRPSLANRVDLL